MSILRYTHEEIVEKLQGSPVVLLEPYHGTRKHHLFKCKQCDYKWETRLDHVFDGHYCPRCGDTLRYSKEQVNFKLQSQNIKLIGEYVENQTKTMFQCDVCKTTFEQSPLQLFLKRAGCPTCKTTLYQNEKFTGQYLQELFPGVSIRKNYCIKEQVIAASGEVVKKWVLVDYMFSLNQQQHFLEYHGQQHYTPVKFWGKQDAPERFRKQVIRDQWLRRFCRLHNIVLTEIDGRKITGENIRNFLINHFQSPN